MTTPRKIAFLCSWGDSPKDLLTFLARQTYRNTGTWDGLQGVGSIADADFLVVLEDLPPAIRRRDIDLGRTIFLPREPLAVSKRKRYESFQAPLAFTHDDIHHAAVWRVMRPFEELEAQEYFRKDRPLTSVTSAVAHTSGHRTRIDFLRAYARRYPGALDVYGYGWKDELGASYKGELGNRFAKITDLAALCKLEGLRSYRYALAFENSRQKNYFTEKLVDCWLAWTMPIYWGCPNLADYFPEGSYYEIDPSKSDCVEEVADIVSRPVTDRQISAMREARQLVLRRYNIWATVAAIINGRRPQPTPVSLVGRLITALRGS